MWCHTGVHSWPLLFLIYINDIVNSLKYSKAILYADDTNLIFNDKDIHKLIQLVNNDLSSLKTWFAANKLSLNANKTNYIIFHTQQKSIPKHSNIQQVLSS